MAMDEARADAETEGQDSDGGEARGLAEHPQTEPHIVE
jgi:hypothetical protein